MHYNDGIDKTGVGLKIVKADAIVGNPAFYLITLSKNSQERAQLFFRMEPEGSIHYGESTPTLKGFNIPLGEGGFTNGEKAEAEKIIGAAIAKLIQQP